MTRRTKAVPSKLQLDGWWLDHDKRPFPKRFAPAKVRVTEDGQ